MNILFVCSSNICRSPYAELLFKKMVDENEVLKKNITVIKSAGLLTFHKGIFPKTSLALQAENISAEICQGHIPTHFVKDKKRFEEADVIIGMSNMHKLLTPRKYRNKFKTLSEVAVGKSIKIPDPFMMKQDDYNKVMEVIKMFLEIYAKNLEQSFSAEN